jgi:hypothetical protein
MSGAQRAGTIARARRSRSAARWTSARPLLVALVLAATLIAGCSSNGTPAPTTTPTPAPGASTAPATPGGSGGASSGTPAFCDAANKLRASVGALGSLSVNSSLTDVQTTIDNIQTSLTQFQAAAKSQFAPQVQQMRTALNNVTAAIRAAGASPNSSSITAIGSAAASVVAAYTALQQAIGTRCG